MNDFLRVPLHTLPGPSAAPAGESGCVIDCDTCAVRGDACADCVVSVIVGGPPDVVAPDDQRALGVLAGLGLVPPLLMTPPGQDAQPGRPRAALPGQQGGAPPGRRGESPPGQDGSPPE